MPLDEPFSRLTPGPQIPGDDSFGERARASASDTGAGLRAVQDFIRRYREVEIKTADGRVVVVLARRSRNAADAPTEWFSVYNISEGTPRVRVVEGRILVPDTSGIGSDPPVVTGLLVEQAVMGADLDVEHGTKIYVKLTTEHPAASVFEIAAESDDYVSVTVGVDVHRVYATAGEVVALTTAPTPTATLSYITLAEISIVDGVMTIKPRHTGAITVPAIITPVLKTVSATSAISTRQDWTCDDGTAEHVTYLVPSS